MKVPGTEPGGWYFEYNNEFYPDTDDTAQVLLALNKVDNPREGYQHKVAQRAVAWELAMQCKNGGWGSFDKDNTKMIFQYIPFADHNAMLDPPTVDITGRILEMLATYGFPATTNEWIKPSGSSSGSRNRMEAGLGAGESTTFTGRSWCSGDWKRSASISTNRRFSRPRSGSAWFRTPMVGGVKPAVVTTTRTPAAWA